MGQIAIVAAFAALAQGQGMKIKSLSVGPDQTLTYPNGPANPPYLVDLPDEHTTVIPPASAWSPYIIFAASKLSGGSGGAVVLQSTDLKSFDFATAQGYNRQVFAPPTPIDQCDPKYQTEFDGNYAAPGSVVQDPTLPPGNLILIYEAENHCPGGVVNAEYYATIGIARSNDNGKTWPTPINGPTGGPARRPVLQNSIPQPTAMHPPSIPKFFVEGGRVYAGGVSFPQFQLFSNNMYWRTDGSFANDSKAFAVQPKVDSTGKSPCSAKTNNWTFYTFAQWQQIGEDAQSVVQNPGFANPAYPADDYSLSKGSPRVGFVPFDPSAGRLNPVIKPPSVPATFPTKSFNPATDY